MIGSVDVNTDDVIEDIEEDSGSNDSSVSISSDETTSRTSGDTRAGTSDDPRLASNTKRTPDTDGPSSTTGREFSPISGSAPTASINTEPAHSSDTPDSTNTTDPSGQDDPGSNDSAGTFGDVIQENNLDGSDGPTTVEDTQISVAGTTADVTDLQNVTDPSLRSGDSSSSERGDNTGDGGSGGGGSGNGNAGNGQAENVTINQGLTPEQAQRIAQSQGMSAEEVMAMQAQQQRQNMSLMGRIMSSIGGGGAAGPGRGRGRGRGRGKPDNPGDAGPMAEGGPSDGIAGTGITTEQAVTYGGGAAAAGGIAYLAYALLL